MGREYGPAVEQPDGYQAWWQNCQRHRIGGPAVVCPSGYRTWYQDGQLHRLDGPAVEYSDGSRAWFQNGQRHRVDGPAIEIDYTKSVHVWYIDGAELTEAGWKAAVTSMGIV